MKGLPVEVVAADPRVLRPADLAKRYADPTKEVLRLVRNGVLIRLAHGYYAVVPEEYRGTRWRPSIEAAGLAVAQADHGRDPVAAMGVTAARLLGVVPRALGEAAIAVTRQRPVLDTTIGRVRFVKRDLERLDTQRTETELGGGWVTTVEQTILDLSDRPGLVDLSRAEIREVILRLAIRADWPFIGALARDQHKGPAAVRAARVAGIEPPIRASRPVDGKGLLGS